ncbi:MAG: hypothetical protein ACR2QO_05920 [Acidimicrobiales bacterium]
MSPADDRASRWQLVASSTRKIRAGLCLTVVADRRAEMLAFTYAEPTATHDAGRTCRRRLAKTQPAAAFARP